MILSKKKKKKREPLPEDREMFIRVYKMFLETLISIYYPIRLEWYELLSMVVLGILFGLGIGRVLRSMMS